MLSAMLSHGSILGCCLKSVNQEQPAVVSTIAVRTEVQIPRRCAPRDDIRTSRCLTLTPHLPRTVPAQHLHALIAAVGRGVDPHAEIASAEARVIANSRSYAWAAAKAEHGVYGRKPAAPHH